jgi:hypothetical protein
MASRRVSGFVRVECDLGIILQQDFGLKVVEGPDGTITTAETRWQFSWQAAAWRLERRHPMRWGRTDHLEVVNPGESKDVTPKPGIDIYSPEYMTKMFVAWAEASLIPEQLLLAAIDVTEEGREVRVTEETTGDE